MCAMSLTYWPYYRDLEQALCSPQNPLSHMTPPIPLIGKMPCPVSPSDLPLPGSFIDLINRGRGAGALQVFQPDTRRLFSLFCTGMRACYWQGFLHHQWLLVNLAGGVSCHSPMRTLSIRQAPIL